MILPIVTIDKDPYKNLRNMSLPVNLKYMDSYSQLLLNMEQTMLFNNGLGLAAPQVGQNIEIFLTNVGGVQIFLNPRIVWRSTETSVEEEGCLSIPNKLVKAKRPTEIRLAYHNEDGQYQMKNFVGLLARVIQHERDHLMGILITDFKILQG